MSEINIVIQQSTNKIDIVMQPLINQNPIEIVMTKPGASVTTANVKAALDITTLSGSNTGDQDLSGLMPISGGTFTGTAIGNSNTSYTTSQLRNARIYADGATVPTLADGELAFIYEV